MFWTKWSHIGRMARQIGIFFLLLMDVALTEDIDSFDEVNGNIAGPESSVDPYMDRSIEIPDAPRPRPRFRFTSTTTPYPNLQYKSRAVLRNFLLHHRVIPDILAVAPSYLMEITYTRRSVVNLGNRMDPALLQKMPRYVQWPWQNQSLYSLVLVDADVPSRSNPRFDERIHWLVVNIPGRELRKGDQVVTYMGPLAPPHTGMHRYVFAIFKQFGKLDYDGKIITSTSNKLNTERLYFSIRNFSMKYRLRDPVAVNFFLCGWPLDQKAPTAIVPTKSPRRKSPPPPLFPLS